MLRTFALALPSILIGCGGAAPAPVLPVNVTGGYKLGSNRGLPITAAPELVRQLGLRSAHAAQYSGPETVNVTLYEMTTGAGAFELVQKWKPESHTLYFSQTNYFVLLHSPAAPEKLQAFASALDSALKSAKGAVRAPQTGQKHAG